MLAVSKHPIIALAIGEALSDLIEALAALHDPHLESQALDHGPEADLAERALSKAGIGTLSELEDRLGISPPKYSVELHYGVWHIVERRGFAAARFLGKGTTKQDAEAIAAALEVVARR